MVGNLYHHSLAKGYRNNVFYFEVRHHSRLNKRHMDSSDPNRHLEHSLVLVTVTMLPNR
jgi:hypothetical protein